MLKKVANASQKMKNKNVSISAFDRNEWIDRETVLT